MEEIYNAVNVFNIYKFFNLKDNTQCINYEILYDGGNRNVYELPTHFQGSPK
jgi:hypothetical protein